MKKVCASFAVIVILLALVLPSYAAYTNIYLSGFQDLLTPVPVPAAVWLLGSGLIGLICFRRRQNFFTTS